MIPYEKQLIYRNEIGFSVVRTNIQFNRFYWIHFFRGCWANNGNRTNQWWWWMIMMTMMKFQYGNEALRKSNCKQWAGDSSSVNLIRDKRQTGISHHSLCLLSICFRIELVVVYFIEYFLSSFRNSHLKMQHEAYTVCPPATISVQIESIACFGLYNCICIYLYPPIAVMLDRD